MEQLCPAARLLPQVGLLSPKSPLVAMLLIVRADEPALVRVLVWPGLVVPTAWLPNVRVLGARVATDAVAVPVRLVVCELEPIALELSVTVSEPVRTPVAVGWNVTLIVQLEFAASVEGESGQVVVSV